MTDNNQKYYKLVFPRNCSTDFITLMEQKRLESNEYHPQKSNDYFPVIVFKKKTEFIQESPLLDKKSYEIYQKEVDDCYFRRSNNRDFDDFLYDSKKEIVVYGNTYIYLVKKNGKFYDIVMGEEVPSHSFFKVNEIQFVSEFEEMIKHLTLIRKHQELYRKTVVSIFQKYEEEYLNYKNTQDAYRSELNKLLESSNLETKEQTVSVSLEVEKKKEKIKQIVGNFAN